MSDILTTKNPYYNKWYCALRHLLNKDVDILGDDSELRKLCRICEYLAKNGEFGDAMTIRDIVQYVEDTSILNYDGIGYFVSYKDFSEEKCPDVEDIEALLKKDDTHFFVWYNR